MAVTVQNILNENLKKDYQLTIPADLIENKVNERILEVQKNYSIKGFRKGQVPQTIIRQKYAPSIKLEEIDKIIAAEIKKIISDNNLKIALEPKLDLKSLEDNKNIECVLSFELMPEVPEINLEKINLIKKDVEVSEGDVDEALNKFTKLYSSWNKQEPDYAAKNGDRVNIDYLGKIDGVAFEGGTAQGHNLELGTKSFIDNFEEQLVGKKAGDQIEVKVKFPDNYHNPEYSSKNAIFEVKVNNVSTAQMPDLNEEFIKTTFGLENKEKIAEILKQQVEQNYQNLSRDLFKIELFDLLGKDYDFDLPQGLVEMQLKNLADEELADKEGQETKTNDLKGEKLAKNMVKIGIIINDLADKNNIKVTNDDLNNELSKILAKYPNQQKNILDYYKKNQSAIEQLKGLIIEKKLADFIINQPNIKREKLSVKEFDIIWQKANQ
jgi:trigger factor